MRAMTTASTGMRAAELNVDVISNNMANLSTTAFKRERVEFQDLFYQTLRDVGASSSDTGTNIPSGLQVGHGVQPVATYRIEAQGAFTQTENTYDLAIDGQGFFQIQLPDGTTAYTRAGAFQINQDGLVVTADGYEVIPAITVPQNVISVTINQSGEVLAKIDGQVNLQNLGQLQTATFTNPVGLNAIGRNLLRETDASGAPVVGNPGTTGFGILLQRTLERSNVNVVSEITDLIAAQRAYEMNSKVVETGSEMWRTATNMKA